ncbi:Aste57867_908 [Aphanomyces stellatus]|uniref:Aste57867_908 protein n=1 Tax=Aphanomyces stellatus TaxID=120398 RepID=A0A485K435_9STRA|nr:hypothetical protein As57867_000907 [Aphanomyces stellatus]VFT78132.1 Aste57867_908 [Aphanomyces stellatus]
MLKLPLPPGYFQCPPLSAAHADEYMRQARDCATDIIQLAQRTKSSADGWSVLLNQSDLKIHRGPDVGTSCLCVASMEIAGTIDEAAALFRMESTEEAKEYVERIGRDLADAVLLYSLQRPSAARPLDKTHIAWTALTSPVKNLVLDRDYVLLECHHEFTQPNTTSGTSRGWVRAMRSIDLACCPDLKEYYGLQRAYTLGSGHVFWESTTRPGYIHAAYVMQASFGGNVTGKLTNFLKDMAMKRRCRSLLDIDRFVRENRLSATPFKSLDQLQPKDGYRKCFQCLAIFGWLKTKTHCAKCGHVFCRSCIQLWNVKSHGVRSKIWACTHCGIGHSARTAAPPSTAVVAKRSDGSHGSASSETSVISMDMMNLAFEEMQEWETHNANRSDCGPQVIRF